MQIRPVTPRDLALLSEVDGTIESSRYLHVERTAAAADAADDRFAVGWRVQERPLRERLVRSNPIDDEVALALRLVATGADEGTALMVEHDGLPVALVAAAPDPVRGTLRVVDLRVDFDRRREGLASGLLYAVIAAARAADLRAVAAETTADNVPAARLLRKCGFEIAGLDERRQTNHDLVKEAVTLFWYASLD